MKSDFDNTCSDSGYFKRNKIEGEKFEFENGWSVAELKVSLCQYTPPRVTIKSDRDAANVLFCNWDKELIKIQEQMACLFLNSKNEVIGFRNIGTGKSHSVTFDFNLMMTCAILCRARSIIIAHNHPDGGLKPSNTDVKLTRRVMDLLEFFEIDLLDHIILSSEGYFSFSDQELVIFHNH